MTSIVRYAALLLLLSASTAPATILYDVDFQAPVFQIGGPLVVGAGPVPRDRPSAILNGFPFVTDEMEGLGQCMRMTSYCCEPTFSRDEVEFDLGEWDFPQYGIAFTISIDSIDPGTAFRVNLDVAAGNDHSLQFVWEEGAASVLWGVGGPVIGSWTPDVPLRVRVEASSLGVGQWRVFLDGVLVVNETSFFVGRLDRLHLDTGPSGWGPSVSACIDNVLIWGSATGPISVEPGSWGRTKGLYR